MVLHRACTLAWLAWAHHPKLAVLGAVSGVALYNAHMESDSDSD